MLDHSRITVDVLHPQCLFEPLPVQSSLFIKESYKLIVCIIHWVIVSGNPNPSLLSLEQRD